MRIYEELFIVKPDAPDEEVDQFVEQLRTQLTTAGATVDKGFVENVCGLRIPIFEPHAGSPEYVCGLI